MSNSDSEKSLDLIKKKTVNFQKELLRKFQPRTENELLNAAIAIVMLSISNNMNKAITKLPKNPWVRHRERRTYSHQTVQTTKQV